MKWIKASERLPEFEKDVHAKLGGKSIFGRFYELIGKKRFSVNDRYELDTFYVAEEHFHLIEWLDESQASDKGKEIELLNQTIKNQHKLILSGEKRGYDKAVEEYAPVPGKEESYWQRRCEAAEEKMMMMDIPKNWGDGNSNQQFEIYRERNHIWLELIRNKPAASPSTASNEDKLTAQEYQKLIQGDFDKSYDEPKAVNCLDEARNLLRNWLGLYQKYANDNPSEDMLADATKAALELITPANPEPKAVQQAAKEYPGELCGLSEQEWELEQIVDEIKEKTTLEGIGILRRLACASFNSKDAVEFVWTDELVKEMIYLKLPIPEHYAGNLQKCLDEFKNSDHHKD